jgi:hypothetical protein
VAVLSASPSADQVSFHEVSSKLFSPDELSVPVVLAPLLHGFVEMLVQVVVLVSV